MDFCVQDFMHGSNPILLHFLVASSSFFSCNFEFGSKRFEFLVVSFHF